MTHTTIEQNNNNNILKVSNTSAFKPYNTFKNINNNKYNNNKNNNKNNKYKIYFNDLNLKIKIEENGNIKITNNIAELAEKCLKDILMIKT